MSVRWTTPDQWHVTLRFLGEVADDRITVVIEALTGVAGILSSKAKSAYQRPGEELGSTPTARLGPRVGQLGRHTIVVPVAGLQALATAVRDATADIGDPVDSRPFTGHITLARLKGRGWSPATEDTVPSIAAEFSVSEILLVRSRLHHPGARYEIVATVPCVAQGPDV